VSRRSGPPEADAKADMSRRSPAGAKADGRGLL
jgi:hypothetical protein